MQDTHLIPEIESYIESQWRYMCIFNPFSSNSRGVFILFNNDFEFKIQKERKDCEGNLLALDTTIVEIKVTIININGSNIDRPVFMTGGSREKNPQNISAIFESRIFFYKTIQKIYVDGIAMVYEQAESHIQLQSQI